MSVCVLSGAKPLFAGVSIYGLTEMGPEGTALDCGLHKTVVGVAGVAGAFLPGKVGWHRAVAMADGGVVQCFSDVKTRKADLAFAQAALSCSVPGFAYLRDGGLPAVRHWETGASLGLAAFGKGYCYLALVRPRFRMRVARLLGPAPLLSDVLLCVRLAGAFTCAVVVESVAEGLFHLAPGVRVRKVRDVVHELIGLAELQPCARVGAEVERHEISVVSQESVKEKKSKEWCEKCSFFVVMDGHEARCAKKIPIDKKLAYIGDALHTLDVRVALVQVLPEDSKLHTVVSQQYCGAEGQVKYMRRFFPRVSGDGLSARQLSSLFEEMYTGEFRELYCKWLQEDLGEVVVFDPDKLMNGPQVYAVHEVNMAFWLWVCCVVLLSYLVVSYVLVATKYVQV